jgi:hypothetical protein
MVKEYDQEGNWHEASNKWRKCLAKMWDYTETEGSLEAKMSVHIGCSRKPGITKRDRRRGTVFSSSGCWLCRYGIMGIEFIVLCVG